MDGLLDIMFQPPKAAGPFQTIFEITEKDKKEIMHKILEKL